MSLELVMETGMTFTQLVRPDRGRSRLAQALQQGPGALLDRLHVVELDLLVPPDTIGEAGDLENEGIGLAVEVLERRLEQGRVPGDEAPLLPANGGVAEDVPRRAPEAPPRAEQAENRDEPGAERQLSLDTQRPEQRRLEVVHEAPRLGEQAERSGPEPRLQVEARDLVLVLVGHELVKGADHRPGDLRPSLRNPPLARGHPEH